MSHTNIYDTHDDIIESPEDSRDDSDDTYEYVYKHHDEPEDESDEDDSLSDHSGSGEDLNRFKLKNSEKLIEDGKEDESPKPYTDNTQHDYVEDLCPLKCVDNTMNSLVLYHLCKIDEHKTETHGEKPGPNLGNLKCPPTNAKSPKEKSTTKISAVAVVTTPGPITTAVAATTTNIQSTTIKKCSNGADPNTDVVHGEPQPHCFDNPNYHESPGSPIKEEKRIEIEEKRKKIEMNVKNRNRLYDGKSPEKPTGDGELDKNSLVSLPYPEVTNGPGDLLDLWIDINGKYQQVFPVNETHAETTKDPGQANDDQLNRSKPHTIKKH